MRTIPPKQRQSPYRWDRQVYVCLWTSLSTELTTTMVRLGEAQRCIHSIKKRGSTQCIKKVNMPSEPDLSADRQADSTTHDNRPYISPFLGGDGVVSPRLNVALWRQGAGPVMPSRSPRAVAAHGLNNKAIPALMVEGQGRPNKRISQERVHSIKSLKCELIRFQWSNVVYCMVGVTLCMHVSFI